MDNQDKHNLILVTYDFTEQADCAMNHASFLAKKSSGDVGLVHIINNDTKSKFTSGSASVESVVQNKMDKICEANTALTGVKTFPIIREGSIFTTIAEIAEETKAKLIILGTHGVRGMQHVLGAFALKVVTSSPAPVIIVQSKNISDHGYKTLVLPIDESVETKQKTNQAIAIAKEHNSDVHILRKFEKDEYLKIKVNGNANYVKNELVSEGVNVVDTPESHSGKNYSKEVMRYASSINADLLVLTTKKEKEIADIFIGDEDVKIINNDAQIPVLCVNAKNYNIMGSAISFGGFN